MHGGKAPSTTTSAELISSNDDLLLQILILLPAKSLIRFKSVSKHWHSLIFSASFRRLHTRLHRRPQTSFLLKSSSHFFYFNPTSKNFVPFRFKFERVEILQSCNGLLLLQCGFPHTTYYVYNPTTGESRKIFFEKNNHYCLFLSFDPSKSPHYKVACLKKSKIEVYDSETHEWNVDKNAYSVLPPPRDWVYSDNLIYSVTHQGYLICFDFEKLTFLIPSQPKFVFCVMESFGHVHRIVSDVLMNCLEIDEMTIKNGELSFKHLIDFDVTDWCSAKTPGNILFLGVIRGDTKEECFVFHIPGKIMAYRFDGGRFEELLDCSSQGFYEDSSMQFGCDSYPFVESLTPV